MIVFTALLRPWSAANAGRMKELQMKRSMASSAPVRLLVLVVLVVLAGAGAHRAWPVGLVHAANVSTSSRPTTSDRGSNA